MQKKFVKTVSTIIGQFNIYKQEYYRAKLSNILDINDIIINITISFCESEAYKSSCQQL